MSPLVGLFFAVEDADVPTDGALWALNPGFLNWYMVGSNRFMLPDDAEVQETVAQAYEPRPGPAKKALKKLAGRAVAVGTREIDPRVMVQQGAFTIHADGRDLADPASTLRYLIRLPVSLLSWWKLIFSRSDVAGNKAIGHETRESFR
jgi:hypothetical protein